MLLWSDCQRNRELDKVWVQQKWLHLEEQGQHHDFQLMSSGLATAAQLEAATCIPPEHLTRSPGLLQNQRLLQKSCKPKSLHTLQHLVHKATTAKWVPGKHKLSAVTRRETTRIIFAEDKACPQPPVRTKLSRSQPACLETSPPHLPVHQACNYCTLF